MEHLVKGKRSANPIVAKINKNFIVKYKEDGKTRFELIGGGRYHLLVGQDLANKHFEKVLKEKAHKYTIKLRRGLTIVFHSK